MLTLMCQCKIVTVIVIVELVEQLVQLLHVHWKWSRLGCSHLLHHTSSLYLDLHMMHLMFIDALCNCSILYDIDSHLG